VKFGSPRRPDPLVDVTPMIDVVFQLVLFFMVSTTFVSTPGIQVDLPRSNSQTLQATDDDLNVWLSCVPRGGVACGSTELHLGSQSVTLAQLASAFQAAATEDLETLVVMKADQGVSHGAVVRVMDAARSTGLTRLAIATEADSDDE
jgi:biopolymer transport protein ExbD